MKPRNLTGVWVSALLVLLIGATQAQAAIIWAGTSYVELDASDASAGTAVWTNTASDPTIGNFNIVGDPAKVAIDTAPAVYFDGDGDAYVSTGNTPGDLTGAGDRTVEAWVYNPSIPAEDTVLSWAKRGGPCGTNWSFGHGTHGEFGALGAWCGEDLGWNGAPSAMQWHHLAITYDGTTTRVYADGAEKNSEVVTLGTHADLPIKLAVQHDGNGVDLSMFGSLAIGRVRVHGGALSASDVLNNYNEEKAGFPLPPPPVPQDLTAAPVHRWSFSETGGAGTTLVDSIGGANGAIIDLDGNPATGGTVGGGQVTLTGGGKDTSDYVELPEGLISGLTDGTIETWATQHTVKNWSRIFDFGKGTNEDYIMMSWTRGTDINLDRVGIRIDNVEHCVDETMAPYTLDTEFHIVMTIDDDGTIGGDTLITVYKDGQFAGCLETTFNLADVEDLANWIGRSMWGDETANASYNEFRIYDYCLSADEVLGNYGAGADTVTPEPATLALLALGGLALLRRRR